MANVIQVQTISDLLAVTPLTGGQLFQVAGYYAPLDGGGGLWRWDAASDEQPNYGSVIGKWIPNNGSSNYEAEGRFLLVHEGFVNIKQFGAIGDKTDWTPITLEDQIPARFDSVAHIEATYVGSVGTAFSGLITDQDTVDWAATQVAIEWCAANGVRLEAPTGVYTLARPLWLGDDSYVAANEHGDKSNAQLGFTFVGQTHVTRQQADDPGGLGSGANFRLTRDCANRYAFSMPGEPPSSEAVALHLKVGGLDVFTSGLIHTDTAQDLVDAIDAQISLPLVVDLDGTDPGAVLGEETVFFTVRLGVSPSAPPDFLGEILTVYSSDHGTLANWAHCFPDSGIVSFRRSAGGRMRVTDLTLKGNNANDSTDRNASFGVLFVTTQFVGHVVERLLVSFVDTTVGLLQGTGENGEQCRIDRLAADQVRRMLYTNAPQAFQQEFYGWNGILKNIDEDDDLDGLVFAEFDDATSPGFGAFFHNIGVTFSKSTRPETDGTLVTVRRGTGVVQFIGGRAEHLTRLFHYDAFSGQGVENNMDVVFRGVEFTCVGGGDRRIVHGENIDDVEIAVDTATQYGLFVEDCTFHTFDDDDMDPHPEYGDLILETLPYDRLRCVFEKCRFLGVRSLQQRSSRAAFRRCYKNDFISAGANQSPLREFSDEPPTPGERTQSLRNAWQDTPWIQTGPRTNILRNAALTSQAAESTGPETGATFSTSSSWALLDSAGDPETSLAGFGRWGAFDDANIDMSPNAFYVALDDTDRLETDLDAFDLDGAFTKVATYQCLCRVLGKMRFALVKSDDEDTVYDEIVIDSQGAYCDPTLVTLRGQVAHDAGSTNFRIRVENLLDTPCRWQVTTQQAWGGTTNNDPVTGFPDYPLELGLANQTFVSTLDNMKSRNRFPWSVNALSVMAQSRLRIPAKPQRYGWEQRAYIDPVEEVADLRNGEVYYDEDQKAVLMVMNNNQMFVIHQPERVEERTTTVTWQPGRAKNLVFTPLFMGSDAIVTFETDTSVVPDGTMVRVYRAGTTYAVKVKFGSGGTEYTIDNNKMGEYAFAGGKWYSVVHNQAFVKQ